MAKSNEQKAATSPQLPLFYQSPAPLDSKAHRDLGLKKNFGLSFTRQVNAVPVNLIEMPQICHVYPIAFSPDDNATPVAILGLRDNENLFLDTKGEWLEDTYIPAYIRRYPFIFSEMPGSDNLSLCIDMVDTVTEKGGEQKFFDAEGKPTQLAQNALEFCKSYHAAAQHTIAFPGHWPHRACWWNVRPKSMSPRARKLTFRVSVSSMSRSYRRWMMPPLPTGGKKAGFPSFMHIYFPGHSGKD
jgi:hypothetical protein